MNDLLTERDALVARLEDENARLRRELAAKDQEITTIESQNTVAIKNLRRALSPLYTALRQVFGEIEAVAGPEDSAPATAPASSPASNLRWDSWKQKLPGRPAEMIDLLLLHGEMNRNQLMAGMHAGKDVVRITISKLNVAGLLVKNGGRVSLKPL